MTAVGLVAIFVRKEATGHIFVRKQATWDIFCEETGHAGHFCVKMGHTTRIGSTKDPRAASAP